MTLYNIHTHTHTHTCVYIYIYISDEVYNSQFCILATDIVNQERYPGVNMAYIN